MNQLHPTTAAADSPARFVQLHRGGTSVVVECSGQTMPRILHWGAPLDQQGPLSGHQLAALSLAIAPQPGLAGLEVPARMSLLPQESEGWQHLPGLQGHRAGRAGFPRFVVEEFEAVPDGLSVRAADPDAGLEIGVELQLGESGLLRQRLSVRNTGETAYEVLALGATFPFSANAAEILDSAGRHLKERSPQRRPLTVGTHLREGRRGRTGADAPLLLAAGTAGFGFQHGTVHAVHLAWSGNYRLSAERTVEAQNFFSAAELLLPGEIILAPGESYRTPWSVGSWGEGLDELAARFHQDLRSRPEHPKPPRPVTLNSWEAVYFDHDLGRLTEIAQAAAAAGVERFVLDDGWFGSRRNDSSGLGDWQVSTAAWPAGLKPLVDTVRGLGMQFGLWFEPEMANLDSDLARSHPEWILHPGATGSGRWPASARQQQVLNLANPDAWRYLFDAISGLVAEHSIDYLKWDHNRDLLEPVDPRSGVAAVHESTLAAYRLMAELKATHPGLEIESCASGGARVDLGVLAHTDRIWVSDCIEPIERLDNQAYTGLLVPYEMMGAHIGGPQSHTTHRTHTMDFRASSALFGHLGVEWDISQASEAERAELARWISIHKTHRGLFHSGRSVHADLTDPSLDLRGVVAQDRSEAVFALTQRSAPISNPAGPVAFPGLDPAKNYLAELLTPVDSVGRQSRAPLPWNSGAEPLQLSGAALASVGLQMPILYPENAVVIRFTQSGA
ncbi:alpha-galactosidase [Arthrobacter russicus]|jgi:alpha-galactosidase|uniref:alpha-galactosidase n=1 Tax=Arthrobacter russicus TaxID=172040 RepID=A0ABU1JAF2_9MICC|nr:alpha-galactosidase [Arthrobacter russicus]MDR6269407.1 alpha-galactosidase [Arthrobacter russicus]